MPELDEGQYAYRGFVFGDGTDFPLAGPIEGLTEWEARVTRQPKPRGHGDVPGKHFLAGKQMLATFTLGAGTPAEMEAALSELADAFQSSEDDVDELEWREHGHDQRMVRCRPIDFKRGYQGVSGRSARPKVALLAEDPRIYSAELVQVNIPLYTASGGSIDHPVDYPKDFAAGTGLDAVAHNAGNADAYPTIRWYGPAAGTLTAVGIANLTTGESVEIVTTVTADQILTFDGSAYVTGSGELVVGLDGSSRYGSWEHPRVPLRLAPGDNVLRFTITGTATTVPCNAEYRHTSLS